MTSVAVLGAGAWGTALANAAARAGRTVTLWGRDPAAMQLMAQNRENARRLPGVALADGVVCESDLARAARADVLLAAVPAQQFRSLAISLASLPLQAGTQLVICAKGVERGTGAFLSEIAVECLPQAAGAAILSGPSFARDVASGLPTAVTLAAADDGNAERLATLLSAPGFRLYRSTDVRGVEIGGAAKNVLAIACGAADGRGLGASAIAALVARGFAEIRRFGAAFGARPETLMGLAGLGDVVLTCASPQSRNYAFGLALGRGSDAVRAAALGLAEGSFTAPILVELARSRSVEMPIAEAVAMIVDGRLDVAGAVESLLSRPLKAEL